MALALQDRERNDTMQPAGVHPTGTIEVYSAGCVLCQDTLALLTQAAQGRSSQVVERRVADTDVPGLRALPAIAFLDAVVFEGRASPEQARALVKREELDRRVLAHAIPNSEAMQRFARGDVQINAAIALAREYYPVCLEFPLFLAAAISHVRQERTRLLLVGNLYEEHGDLDPARTHPALFREYIRALGLEPDALATPITDSPGARVVERFRTVCREGPDYRALAMLYAFETLFSPACALVASGLRHLPLAPGAPLFFEVHAVTDVAHAEQLRVALFAACRSEEEWCVAVDTAGEASRLLYTLFDSVARVS